jgi:MFS family permease
VITPAQRRSTALSPSGFYGWHVVAYAAIALAATGPGQTVGISLFIDPLIADLGISRSAVSTAYLIGTLAGALALPSIGRLVDRYGVRRSMAVIGGVFGAVLIGISFATSVLGLTAGFVGIRMAGQGALGLTATTAIALWFHRRRGLAAGIVSAFGALGISSTPLVLEYFLLDLGWRTAWRIEGLVIWALVIPLALLGMRDRPSDLGQHPDGPVAAGEVPPPQSGVHGLTRAQALRSPYFWLIASAVAMSGLLTTAVSFHQISLLTARGLTQAEAAANFVPQTVVGLVATLAAGHLMDRFAGRWMIVASMTTLSAALVWATVVGPGLSAIAYGAMLGAAGSIIRAVEAASLPRAFGTRHIGAIRGLVVSISVGGTAAGPLLFAAVFEATGSYGPVLLASALPPVLVAAWSLVVREPVLIPDHVDQLDPSTPSPRPAR